MTSVLQDVRFGLRMLRRSPSLAVTAALTLALGIGANSTIFSVVNAAMFRPLHFHNPDRLLILREQNMKRSHWRNPALGTSLDWRKHAHSFEQIEFAVNYSETTNIVAGNEAQRIDAQFVSPGLLRMLGLKPVLGRDFNTQDPAQSNVLISHTLWQRLWGGDPKVLGKRLATSGGTYTIVGVMPPDTWVVPFARDPVWIPLDPAGPDQRPDTRWWSCIGRLKPGATVAQARAEMRVFGQRLAEAHPETNQDWGAAAVAIRESWIGDDKYLLYMLMGAVGFVLLIACANVANLLLARSSARTTEMAIRASIGGSRIRIARQLLTESVLLSLIGGALGLGLSYGGVALMMSLIPDYVSIGQVAIDGTVLGFTLGLSMLTGVLFGLAPAIRVSGLDLNRALKEGGDRSGGSRQLGGNLLVVGEVALTMVLLAGAGLMINSFIRVSQVDAGFDRSHLLTANLELDGTTYRELLADDMQRVTPAVDAFFHEAVERLAKIPGVVSATLEGGARQCPIRIAGHSEESSEGASAVFMEVGTGYFSTMRIPVIAGRAPAAADDERAPWIAVINAAMAKRYFSHESPIGQQLFVSFTDTGGRRVAEGRAREIVGIVGDVREFGVGQPAPAMIYVPERQHIRDYPGGASRTHLSNTLMVRTSGEPLALSETVRKVLAGIDRTQVVSDVQSMEQAAAEGLAQWRIFTQIFGFLSAVAIVLAAGGIYGVVSYTVSRRTHEIGVRIALGAGSHSVLGLVLKQGVKLAVPGILIGLAGAYVLTRGIGDLLYGVSPTDWPTLSIVSLLLAFIALAACYLPARRAVRVDPVRALRNE
ncbi:MAG TPA: ABC transporter permease [Bryobacteraceae bacterium]|nr:ABC transporter permease [Bryobacteraceae bacterium]